MMVPTGIILGWYGALEEIPPGWAACDGENGTPDLTDAFIPGAGNLFEFYERQGGTDHNHFVDSGSHVHDIFADNRIAAGNDFTHITDSAVPDFVTTTVEMLPPYHAIVYIMKL